MTGCKHQDRNILSIAFHLPENGGDTLTLFYENPVDFSRQDEQLIILDSLGQGGIQVDWGAYVFGFADIGGEIIKVICCPRGELLISGNTSDLPNTLAFSGTGAEANEYLSRISEIQSKHDLWEGKPFNALDSVSYCRRKNNIRSRTEILYAEYSADTEHADTLVKILNHERELKWLFQDLFYAHVTGAKLDTDVGVALENSSFLRTRSGSLSTVLTVFLMSHVTKPIWDMYGSENYDSVNYILPELQYERIMALEISDDLKELLVAKAVYTHLNSAVLTPAVDSVYSRWKEVFPGSEYSLTVENKYKALRILDPGSMAPEICGISPEGDSIRLSELRGHVVYIKVWATWCSPCVKSFPDLVKLKEDLALDEQLVFLNISVDRDLDSWRSMLSQKQIPGIHMTTDSDKLYKDYLIWGIPRYILIDRVGKVVDAKALPPSESELKGQIRSLI